MNCYKNGEKQLVILTSIIMAVIGIIIWADRLDLPLLANPSLWVLLTSTVLVVPGTGSAGICSKALADGDVEHGLHSTATMPGEKWSCTSMHNHLTTARVVGQHHQTVFSLTGYPSGI